jgi:hypothetical protein
MEVALYTGDARLFAARLDELQAAHNFGKLSTIQRKLSQVQHAAEKCKVRSLALSFKVLEFAEPKASRAWCSP